MEKEKQNEFIKELQQLCEKHNLRHCAFTGIDDESYIGIRCLDEPPSMGDV